MHDSYPTEFAFAQQDPLVHSAHDAPIQYCRAEQSQTVHLLASLGITNEGKSKLSTLNRCHSGEKGGYVMQGCMKVES